MYQALYRKWRPKDFEDVVGQDHITVTLKNEVASGKFSHAYLFTGSRGTGKTTCSKIIAKAVNCLHPVDGNPCNECEICRGIDEGSILDVVEIDAASNNGVDNIRQLREEAYFMPSVAKYRVYILDECHMLSAGAVNALLKILEEPPEHVIFILATTEIHKVLPTILSRCQRFDFKRIKSRTIADRLLYVAGEEGFSLTDDAALLIARLSDGGMRDALSLLDLCTSYTGEINVRTVTEAAGLAGQGHLFDLAAAAIAKDPTAALRTVEALSENSVDFARLTEQLVGHFRNLMLVKTVKEPEELVQATPEDLERLRTQAKGITLPQVLMAIDLLQETMGKISRTAFKRTEFEMALIRLCDQQLGGGLEGVLDRLEKLERAMRTGVRPAAPEQPEAAAASASPAAAAVRAKPAQAGETANLSGQAAAPSAPKPGTSEVMPFPDWAKVLSELQPHNGALYGAMIDSRAYTSGDLMLIDCANDMFRQLLRTSIAAKESLRDAILAVTGRKYNLGPYNPQKHTVAQKTDDPLEGLLKKASELNVPLELK
ncbi:DNA polymerase III subunit gamma/tau [Anaerotruncus rubiinfantis]|uniref:DNA polymerase III subunit gamma/tau n=1 Tax=Anaerotruncus rubiinfantis TaxID=1720200 RepID=UPI00189AFA07|nr:DNA polymerase III subunit gamma/tau [Anaerotruncus rubiinfantis]